MCTKCLNTGISKLKPAICAGNILWLSGIDPKNTGLVQDSQDGNNLKKPHMIVSIDTRTADKNQNILDIKKKKKKLQPTEKNLLPLPQVLIKTF